MLPKCFRDVMKFELVSYSSSYAKVQLDDEQTVILPYRDLGNGDLLVCNFIKVLSDLQIACSGDNIVFCPVIRKVDKDDPLAHCKDWVREARVVNAEEFCREYNIDANKYDSPIMHNECTGVWYFDNNGERLTEWVYDTSRVAYKLGVFCDGTSLWIKEGF